MTKKDAVATKEDAMRTKLMKPEFQTRITDVCVASTTAGAFTKMVLLQLYKNPKLAECTFESMAASCLDAAGQGIEIDGIHAYLLPYKNKKKDGILEANLSIDFKGYIRKALQTGALKTWDAYIVHNNDVFTYINGVPHHEVNFKEDRGEAFMVFSKATLPDGECSYETMTKEDVMKVKAASPAGDKGPWKTWEHEMWKKSVIRRHRKKLDLGKEFDALAAIDSDTIDINADVSLDPVATAPKRKSDAERPQEAAEDVKPPEGKVEPTPEQEKAKEEIIAEIRELEGQMEEEQLFSCLAKAGLDVAEMPENLDMAKLMELKRYYQEKLKEK